MELPLWEPSLGPHPGERSATRKAGSSVAGQAEVEGRDWQDIPIDDRAVVLPL